MMSRAFQLRAAFLSKYQTQKPNFGANGLGGFVFNNTYSRLKLDGSKETWFDTNQRVVEGTFSMLQELHPKLSWDLEERHDRAEKMFECFFNMDAVPPGRGLWAMGSELTTERKLYAALNNCAFTSTKPELLKHYYDPYCFMLDASMMGIGVGFDTEMASRVKILAPHERTSNLEEFVIPDSREGWVAALRLLLSHYFYGSSRPIFNYSEIRPAGTPIRGFGGISSGYKPLESMLTKIDNILLENQGLVMTTTMVADIMNIIGCCVIAGNIRRSAQIAFGYPSDDEFLELKNPTNSRMMTHGWASNNSVLAHRGMDYSRICQSIVQNGEPGLFWLSNARKYGRVRDTEAKFSDIQVRGANPCVEQTLEHMELCCLGEIVLRPDLSLKDFKQIIETVHLYCKIVTLGLTPWEESNKVIKKNRRMGMGLTNIQAWLSQSARSLDQSTADFLNAGYLHARYCDKNLAKKYGFPESKKLTTVKPSGTVSIVVGATPGVHFPIDRIYQRRVRLSKLSEIYKLLLKEPNAQYVLEDCVLDPTNTAILSFFIHNPSNIKTQDEVSLVEQLEVAAFFQKHWSDNAVSCTVTFDPNECSPDFLADQLKRFETQLKGISFLPMSRNPEDATTYAQMPYEKISQAKYEEMSRPERRIDWNNFFKKITTVSPQEHRFCDSEKCELQQ
jgi:adenosylcobalamin-dependent ribonucleoside-triphosphate reductase